MIPIYHPKLTERIIVHTSQAVIGFLIGSGIFVWIYKEFIPAGPLSIWVSGIFAFVSGRYINSKKLAKYIRSNNTLKVRSHTSILLFLIICSALIWSASAFLVLIYAPSPYEFVSLFMIFGIAAMGALTLTPFFHMYSKMRSPFVRDWQGRIKQANQISPH